MFVFIATKAYALEIDKKYPHYHKVLSTFDIDESYLYDEDFRRFSLLYEKKLASFHKRSLQRGQDVVPTLKTILLSEDFSTLFIYLSMIESGFSTQAISSKKAVGLWQFMPKTARQYGLKVSGLVDERYNTSLATYSALKYLKKLHKQFGKWYLAMMAYNCGEGRLTKAIAKAQSDELSIISQYVPKETAQYIKKILLISLIGESKEKIEKRYDPSLTKVSISPKSSIKEIAKLLDMPKEALLKINSHIKNKIISENTAYIYIPNEKIYAFYLSYELSIQDKEEKNFMLTHKVKLGESLKSIAKMYDIGVEEIKNANFLEDSFLVLDSELMLFVSEEVFERVK